MRKNTILFLSFFALLLWDLPPVSGHRPDRNGAEEGRRAAAPWISSKDGADKDSGSGEYEALKEQLDDLMNELRRLEREATDKIQKEMIPLIKREIERLREWLKNLRPKKDRQEPVLTRFKSKSIPGLSPGPAPPA